MSELSERAREIAENIVYSSPDSDIIGADDAIQWHAKRIEQALLGERQRVWATVLEECRSIERIYRGHNEERADGVRGAIYELEKLATPRGGE